MAKKTNQVVEVNEVKQEVQVTTETPKVLATLKDFDQLLKKHKDEAESIASAYNDLDDDSTPKSVYQELAEKANKAVKAYNDVSLARFLHKIRKAANPMAEVAKCFSYPAIKAQVKNMGEDGTGLEQMAIVDQKKALNLKTIDTKLGHKFGADAKWMKKASDLHRLFAIKALHELKFDSELENFEAEWEKSAKIVNASFDIVDDAMDILNVPDILSGTKARMALQQVIDAMLGTKEKFQCVSIDVKLIDYCFCKIAKEAGKVKAVNFNQFLNLLLHVMWRLVTKGTYNVEFPVKKS